MASASSTAARRALQGVGWQQAGQAVVELVGAAHAARGEQARQQRVHAGLFEREGGARRHVAASAAWGGHRASSTAAGDRLRQRAARRCHRPCAAGAKAARRASPHRVSWRAAAGRASPAGRRPAPARRRTRRPSPRPARAPQALVDLHAGRGSASGRRPQPLSQTLLTGRAGLRLAPVVQRVRVQQHLHLVLQPAPQARVARLWAASGRRCGRSRGRATQWQVGQHRWLAYQRSGAP
jgi:hypothetical protein